MAAILHLDDYRPRDEQAPLRVALAEARLELADLRARVLVGATPRSRRDAIKRIAKLELLFNDLGEQLARVEQRKGKS